MADEFERAVAQSVEAARACFKRCAVGTHQWKDASGDRVAIFFADGSGTMLSGAQWTRIRGW